MCDRVKGKERFAPCPHVAPATHLPPIRVEEDNAADNGNREALASSLLEQGASLAVISEILGHVDSKSTSVYLHTDINGLKACALDPEEVLQNACK